MNTRRIVIMTMALVVVVSTPLAAQVSRFILPSIGYFERHFYNKYDSGQPTGGMPTESFWETWRSVGIGAVTIFGDRIGYYQAAYLLFPAIDFNRNPPGSLAGWDVGRFRIGLDTHFGVGGIPVKGDVFYLAWGAGLHFAWTYFYGYPDPLSYTANNFFTFGLGGNVYGMFQVSPDFFLQLGVGFDWDFAQATTAVSLKDIYSYGQGLQYSVSLGVGYLR